MADVYLYGQDIPCFYTLGSSVKVNSGDRIAIFRVPWSSIHDYVAFVWAKDGASEMRQSFTYPDHLPTLVRRKVFSPQHMANHPPDDEEYYQFCYVSEVGEILGGGTTFQVYTEKRDHDERTVSTDGCRNCIGWKAKVI
jgi:hypothetical protein